MSVGNDVVDLRDPEAALRNLHPRFAERVFTAGERETLRAARQASGEGAHHALHWALWAAKESAYKALARELPAAVFSPPAFEVTLPARSLAGGRGPAEGTVRWGDRCFALSVHSEDEWIHAVARSTVTAGACSQGRKERRVLAKLADAERDPSASARRLATTEIATALGLDPAALHVDGRPPCLMRDGECLLSALSLSHHGRFVAFACLLPDVLGPASPTRDMLSS